MKFVENSPQYCNLVTILVNLDKSKFGGENHK